MSRIVLSPHERTRFAAYLHAEAETDGEMAEQAARVGMPEAVVKQMRTRALAKKLVAEDLEGWEEVELSRSTPTETPTGGEEEA